MICSECDERGYYCDSCATTISPVAQPDKIDFVMCWLLVVGGLMTLIRELIC